MRQRRLLASLALLAAVACGGGASSPPGGTPPPGGGTPPPPGAPVGIAMPTELSALPPRSAAGLTTAALRKLAAGAAAPAGSDYASAPAQKYVDERALDQFEIFNVIFGALAQTHYADAGNVGAGPYRALVEWKDEGGGSQNGKTLEDWVVDSTMVQEGGADVNVVHVWMIEPPHDAHGPKNIAIEVRIREAPTRRADGSYADYGVWTIQAQSDDAPPMSFAASASRDAAGVSTILVHQQEERGEMRGVLQRGDGSGLGRVSFPNEVCTEGHCTSIQQQVAYAYDADAVALSIDGAAPVYKSRTQVVDVVNRYGLYDAITFDDVARTHRFGFSVAYTTLDGFTHYGYYGAWQGRHSIWVDGQQGVPEGAQVVRSDRGGAPVAYTASPVYTGLLVKRTPEPATLGSIQGIALQGQEQRSFSLSNNGASGWTYCVNPHWEQPPGGGPGAQVCDASGPYTALDTDLVVAPGDRRYVSIGVWDQVMGSVRLARKDGAFWIADPNGFATATLYPVAQGATLWVWVSAPIFVVWDGTAWKQKTYRMGDWPQNQPMPTFTAETAFAGFTPGYDYYLNDRGTNYILSVTAGPAFALQIERQVAANPANARVFMPDGTILRRGFEVQKQTDFTSFRFDAAALQLVYETVSAADAAAGDVPGYLVTTGEWGLVSPDPAVTSQFNWEYPQGSDPWGHQQFLVAGDGTLVLLDDPIQLQPVALTSAGNVTKNYALQFDGSWVSGLPDVWGDLSRNANEMSAAVAAEVVAIPDGTRVTDGAGHDYVFKALSTSEFLLPIAPVAGLGLGAASALDLSAAPVFVAPVLGPRPVLPLRYSEGTLVQ